MTVIGNKHSNVSPSAAITGRRASFASAGGRSLHRRMSRYTMKMGTKNPNWYWGFVDQSVLSFNTNPLHTKISMTAMLIISNRKLLFLLRLDRGSVVQLAGISCYVSYLELVCRYGNNLNTRLKTLHRSFSNRYSSGKQRCQREGTYEISDLRLGVLKQDALGQIRAPAISVILFLIPTQFREMISRITAAAVVRACCKLTRAEKPAWRRGRRSRRRFRRVCHSEWPRGGSF